MSDEADKAQDSVELEDEIRRKYRANPKLEVEHTGFCLNCGEVLSGEQRWCDVACRTDWEKRSRR